MQKVIISLVLIGITYLHGANSIQCKLCIGSTTSDCAKDVLSAMVIQDCQPIILPGPPRHHRHRFPHHQFETTSIRNIVDNTIHEERTTSYPDNKEQNDVAQSNDSTESRFSRRKLHASCVYIEVDASNTTTSLVTRGCGYAPLNKDVCEIVKKLNNKVVECRTCLTDECN